jgi:hypothetical protein
MVMILFTLGYILQTKSMGGLLIEIMFIELATEGNPGR